MRGGRAKEGVQDVLNALKVPPVVVVRGGGGGGEGGAEGGGATGPRRRHCRGQVSAMAGGGREGGEVERGRARHSRRQWEFGSGHQTGARVMSGARCRGNDAASKGWRTTPTRNPEARKCRGVPKRKPNRRNLMWVNIKRSPLNSKRLSVWR